MPEGTTAPVAAPAAAAPAASPAPVSTPEAPPAPAVETPAAAAPPVTPSAPTPAAAAVVPPVAEPKRSDFPEGEAGMIPFLNEHNKWEMEQEGQPELVTGDEVPTDLPADAPKEELTPDADKPAEEKPAAAKPAEVDAPTPEGLSKLFEDHPDLKAAVEAAPAAKGALFAMARKVAVAEPILKLIPNEAAAKFAVQTSNEFVSLKTGITLADTPEKMATAAEGFLEQFKLVDDKGAPVLDAKGNPTYGEDLPMFVNEIKKRDTAVRIEDIKGRITANAYATPEGKDNDEQLLAAYEFIAAAESADPGDLDKPNLDGLTPEQRAWQEREEKRLAEERERLGLKDKDLTKKSVQQIRETNRTKFAQEFGASAGRFMGNYLKQQEAAGVAIPRYLMTMKDKATGMSVFAKQAYDNLNEKLHGMPEVRSHAATLEMNAINETGLAARVKFGQEMVDTYLPGIIDDLLKEAGVSLAKDSADKIAGRDNKRADARTEPAAGLPSSPKHLSDEDAMAAAYKTIDAKYPNIDRGSRMEKALQEKNRLLYGAA